MPQPDARPIVTFKAKLWVYPGAAAWHFLTLPKGLSKALKAHFGGQRPGFGSIRVEARVGKTVWKTSIFPDSKRGAYLLPVKREVRVKEGLVPGGQVQVRLSILV